MSRKTKTDVAEATATRALAFLIKHRIKNPTFVRTMTARMSRRMRSPIKRQQVEGWLHPDNTKRVEPRLGVGLLLIAEGRKALE